MSLVLRQKVLLHGVVEVRARRAARQHERIDECERTGCDEFDVKSPGEQSLCLQLRNPNPVCDSTRAPWSRHFQPRLVHIR